MYKHLPLIALFCEPNNLYIGIEKSLLDYGCKKVVLEKKHEFYDI